MISTHEDQPFVDIRDTPPVLDPRGAQKIDADTVYRVGSVSKAYTVLAALKLAGVSMEDPVTKYLPRLRKLKQQQQVVDGMTTVDWDKVTLQSLASHMGDIPSDLVTGLAGFPVDWTELGLPKATDVLGCVSFSGIPPCTTTDFWDNFGKRQPVYAPQKSPLYSNAVFTLLGLVVEAVSGPTFEKFVQKNILDVAGLDSTYYSKPDDKLGTICGDDTI
ncbi:Fc.00g047930.m01.CDS01 [Cosmosporella sp. VM-42]